MKNKIKIFTTGGTIDKIYFDDESRYEVGPPGIKAILDSLNLSVNYDIESLMRKDSLDLTDSDRKKIVKKIKSDIHSRIIITHGTSTMIRTARLLVPSTDKVIVLTGAIEPARFNTSDAVFNTGCAVSAVQILSPGVYIVMNGRIFDSEKVQKNTKKRMFTDL